METIILFDLDGTLLDSLGDLTDSVNHVLQQYGCPTRTMKEIRSFVGNGAEMLIRLSLPGREDDPSLDRVLESFKAYYADHSRIKTKPYDGILEALETISQKHKVAIVSNKPDEFTKALAQELFGGIPAWGESAGCRRKPAPDMVCQAMQALGAKRCVYVGDSEVDVATAKNAGVKCLSVLWGFRDKQCLIAAGAEYFCESPCQMAEMIEKMV